MYSKDFLRIHNFSRKEVENTNADYRGIDFVSFLRLDTLRTLINEPMNLLFNGINSGSHSSKEHPDGKAFDFECKVDFEIIYKFALEVGFKGFGVYYDKETRLYTYHVDTGKTYRFWNAYKLRKKDKWIYGSFFADPADFVD